MRLFDVQASPNCLKVRIAARELGIRLELEPMVLANAREPEYLARNPSGKVPTLIDDDGFTLWESNAILLYLSDKKPELGLLGRDAAQRADAERWLFFAATHLQPWLSLLGQERVIKARRNEAPDPSVVALAERELARFLPLLEQHLSGRDYLGDAFGVADIGLGAGLESCEARGVELAPFPAIFAWRERLRARPSWRDQASVEASSQSGEHGLAEQS